MGVTVEYKCDLCGKERRHLLREQLPSRVSKASDYTSTAVKHTLAALISQSYVLLCAGCATRWPQVEADLIESILLHAKTAFRGAQMDARGAVAALGDVAKENTP